MESSAATKAAIVDYGLGNLFSVKHACEQVGIRGIITSSADEILNADAVILPGVGAFGDAMAALSILDLIAPIEQVACSDKPLIGICLGMQLLMSESCEFGKHKGLGLIEGPVVRLDNTDQRLKVPQVGWNRIYRPDSPTDLWSGTPLARLNDGEFMYFVHSYYVKPVDASVVLSATQYGGTEFCSSLRLGNVFGFQFHPERSGPCGLRIYENIASIISSQQNAQEE